MRAMRLKKREVTDKKVLGEILEECDVVRIGAVDEEGMFIVPVNFGYDFDTGEETTRLVLYFHGAAEGRKAEAFALNPDVAVEMDCCHELITCNNLSKSLANCASGVSPASYSAKSSAAAGKSASTAISAIAAVSLTAFEE